MEVTGSGLRPSRAMTVMDGVCAKARYDRPATTDSTITAATRVVRNVNVVPSYDCHSRCASGRTYVNSRHVSVSRHVSDFPAGSVIVQPSSRPYSLSSVNTAELTLPMLMVGEPEPAAANPEVVRLVALARTGDRAAFGRLIEDHLTAARRLALAAVGQPMDADEAVQEASVAAWTRLDALQDPAAFRGWFMRIVWRKAIDRRRSVRSWFERFGASSSDDRPMEIPDRRSVSRCGVDIARARDGDRAGREGVAAQAARSVPARRQRRSPLRRDRDALGIPIGTVKWRISEARRLIRMKLDRLGHGDPR